MKVIWHGRKRGGNGEGEEQRVMMGGVSGRGGVLE